MVRVTSVSNLLHLAYGWSESNFREAVKICFLRPHVLLKLRLRIIYINQNSPETTEKLREIQDKLK